MDFNDSANVKKVEKYSDGVFLDRLYIDVIKNCRKT